MGKAEIIEDKGSGYYSIKRIYAGREEAQAKIVVLNTNIAALVSQYSDMPESTEDEIFAKHIVNLQIASLRKQVEYIQKNFPDDIEVDAYCADNMDALAGEVGTIDIPGEVTDLVNIRPAYDETAAFDAERDGEFYPSIAVGPWTSFLNKCILPGWQKWFPKYRYAWIVPGSINHDDDTCAVTIQPASSSQQGLDVNQGDGFGAEIIEEEREVSYFYQPSVPAYPGFQDFCARNPGNPICSNTEIGEPIELTNDQYDSIKEINWVINNAFEYENDQSGFGTGEYFDIMNTPGVDKGDCEDFALTKMDFLINAGIIEAKNIQLIFCDVLGLGNGGHAVAGIQTTNRGFIILDNRFDTLMDKTYLSSYYAFEDFQLAGSTIVNVQRLKGKVPIEYMNCNAGAFTDADEVVVEFMGQDWTQPKVIGFKEEPNSCGFWSMFGGEPLDITAYQYSPKYDIWTVKADESQHFSGLYFFTIPDGWAEAHGWQLGLVWPVHIRYEPIVTKIAGNIFSFGGWFDNGDYFEDRYTTAFAIDTCEKFNLTTGAWSRRNKDDYIGRSCGAGWAISGKSYIACGAFYDDRQDTHFPHVELETNYIWGDYEKCNGVNILSAINIEPTPYFNSHYSPEFVNDASPNYDKLYGGHHAMGFIFETGEVIGYCQSSDMWSGAHSNPPPAGVPYTLMWQYDHYPDKYPFTYYVWFDFNPQWGKNGKRWYENQLFGECLRFDDETNAYTQRQSTTPTMMMGSFELGNIGYMVGGTIEEISDIIRSADADGMTNDVKKYDAETNSWSVATGFYEDRLHPSGFEAGGKGYVFSGYSKTNHSGSTEQIFGHEQVPLDHVNGRVHPMSSWYSGGGGSGGQSMPPEIKHPEYGIFPGETVALFCTNTMHEYDSVANSWARKNNALTPRGNCRYREFYNSFGTLERPYFYTLNESNCLVQTFFFEANDPGGELYYLAYHEAENPGPFDVAEHGGGLGTPGPAPVPKIQHIHKYPASSAGSLGYITSDEYMAAYNPVTDSYSIRDDGLKNHESGGMVS